MTEKALEQKLNPQAQKSLETIFKEAHDYLAKLELQIAKLLKKFHLKSDSFDGKLSNSTHDNALEKKYAEILKLKEELKIGKESLNKQALVGQLIGMTMSARGLEMSELSKIAKNSLSSEKLGEFEKEKNKIFDIKESFEFQNELKEASKNMKDYDKHLLDIQENETNKNDATHKINEIRRLDYKLRDGEISENEYKNNISSILKQVKNKEVFTKYYQDYIKNINDPKILNKLIPVFENGLRGFELGMMSGTLPVTLMLMKKTRGLLPALPIIIGGSIWARITSDIVNKDKTVFEKGFSTLKEVGNLGLSVAPVTGTAMAGYDTYNSIKQGKTGDAIANGVGFVVSGAFDIVTIAMVASGVGAPLAVASQGARKVALEGTVLGLKKLFSREIGTGAKELLIHIPNATKEGLKMAPDAFKSLFKKEIWLGNKEKRARGLIHDAYSGMHNILTFKSVRDIGFESLYKTGKGKIILEKSLGKIPGGNKYLGEISQNIERKSGSIEKVVMGEKLANHDITREDDLAKGDESLNHDQNIENNQRVVKMLENIENYSGNFSSERTTKLMTLLDRRLENVSKNKDNKIQDLQINKILDVIDDRSRAMLESKEQINISEYEHSWVEFHKIIKKHLLDKDTPLKFKELLMKQTWGPSYEKFYIKGNSTKDNSIKLLDEINLASSRLDSITSKAKLGRNDKQLKAKLEREISAKQDKISDLDKILYKMIEGLGDHNDITKSIEILNDLKSKLDHDKFRVNIYAKKISEKISQNPLDNIYNLQKLNESFGHIIDFNKLDSFNKSVEEIIKNYPQIKEKSHKILFLSMLHDNGRINEAMKNDEFGAEVINLFNEQNHLRGAINLSRYFSDIKNIETSHINKLALESSLRDMLLENVGANSTVDKIIAINQIAHNEKINVKNIYKLDFEELDSLDKDFFARNSSELIRSIKENKNENFENLINYMKSEKISLTERMTIFNILKRGGIEIKDLNGNSELNLLGYISDIKNKDIRELVSVKNSLKEINSNTDFIKAVYTYIEIGKKTNWKNEKVNIELEKLLTDLNPHADFTKNFKRILENTDQEIKVIEGKGVVLKNTSGSQTETTIDFNNMISIKYDLIATAISKSNLGTDKYHSDIGKMMKIISGVKLHEKISTTDNREFNTILSVNREVDKILLLPDEKLAQLLNEYNMSSFGDRYTKMVVVANNIIQKGTNEQKRELSKYLSNLMKDKIMKNDKDKLELSLDAKLSLIENLVDGKSGDTAFQTKTLEDLISFTLDSKTSLDISELSSHSLFKLLNKKIDDLNINKELSKYLIENLKSGNNDKVNLISNILKNKNNLPEKELVDLENILKLLSLKEHGYKKEIIIEILMKENNLSFEKASMLHSSLEGKDLTESIISLGNIKAFENNSYVLNTIYKTMKSNSKLTDFAKGIGARIADLNNSAKELNYGKIDSQTLSMIKDHIKNIREIIEIARASTGGDIKDFDNLIKENIPVLHTEMKKNNISIIGTDKDGDILIKSGNTETYLFKNPDFIKSAIKESIKEIDGSIRGLINEFSSNNSEKVEKFKNEFGLSKEDILEFQGNEIIVKSKNDGNHIINMNSEKFKKFVKENLLSENIKEFLNGEKTSILGKTGQLLEKVNIEIHQNANGFSIDLLDKFKNSINSDNLINTKNEVKNIASEFNKKGLRGSDDVEKSNNTILNEVKNTELKKDGYSKTLLEKIGNNKLTVATITGLLVKEGLMAQDEAKKSEKRIGEQWQASPEYKKYNDLIAKDPNSLEAKTLKEEAITRITKIVLQKYIATFDAKFQLLMEKRVQELPIGLQGLLGDMNTKIKAKLTGNYDSMTMSRINTFMFNFVDSIYRDKGTAEKNISELPKIAPELANTEIINYLIELGKKYDDAAKASQDAAKAKEFNKEMDIIIEKLKNM